MVVGETEMLPLIAPAVDFTESLMWAQFPDAINHSNFPSPIVRPGTPATSTTLFRFSTQ